MEKRALFEEYGRRFLWHGFIIFVIGCIAGLFLPLYANPRAGLSAHMLGLTFGIFLMAVGLVFPLLVLSKQPVQVTFWSLLISGYVGLAADILAAVFGLAKSFIIAAKGLPGGPAWMEVGVDISVKIISVLTLLACVIILFGLRRVKVSLSSSER